MEIEQAINICQKQAECLETDCMAECEGCPNDTNPDDLEDALQLSISALEKQVPKELYEHMRDDGITVYQYECSECKAHVIPNEKYCARCGQALKWEKEESQ
jgi:hypothetical protein